MCHGQCGYCHHLPWGCPQAPLEHWIVQEATRRQNVKKLTGISTPHLKPLYIISREYFQSKQILIFNQDLTKSLQNVGFNLLPYTWLINQPCYKMIQIVE